MKLAVLIPSRWDSSRFPGKALAPLLGRPLIEHVLRRAEKIPGADLVAVATDHERIKAAVEQAGGRAVLTSPHHPSGSDRLAEAADLLGLGDEDVVLNVQGDQPAFDPENPARLARPLLNDPALEMSTLAIGFSDPREIENPNHVKVVFDDRNLALYFSRAPIPFPRDGLPASAGGFTHYKHIGLYAYRAGFLRRFVKMAPGRLETLEKLEQLRALENGARILVVIGRGLSPEVDVPGDVAPAEAALRDQGF